VYLKRLVVVSRGFWLVLLTALFIVLPVNADLGPVDSAWIKGNRLTPPQLSVSIEAPNGWSWIEVTQSSKHANFIARDPKTGKRFVFSVLTDRTPLTTTLLDDFIAGLTYRIESQKGRVTGLTKRPSAIPREGSYAVTVRAASEKGEVTYAIGYMVAGLPVVFLQEINDTAVPTSEFLMFVSSFRRAVGETKR